MSILGGTPRKLREDAWRAAVSPDGQQIAFIPATYPIHEIWLMGANGEQLRRILAGKEREIFWQVGWSPDGKRVLFGAMDELKGARRNSIQALALDDGERSVISDESARLFQNWRGVLPFSWLPDGRFVFARQELPPNQFSSNLWEVDIDANTAKAIGEPRRLTELAGFNIRDVRVTADGSRLSFLRERGQPDVYVASLEQNGTRLGTPRRVTLDERYDYPAGWTQDGNAVLFYSNRGGTWDLFRQTLDGGAAEPLIVTSENETSPRLSADGAWLLFWRGRRLMRAPSGGGASELVMEATAENNGFHCSIPPARRCVVGEVSGNKLVLWEFDPLVGRGRQIVDLTLDSPGLVNWDLSPDGSLVAVVDFGNHVHIIDLASGSARDLSVRGWTAFEFVAWAANGEWLWLQGFPAKGPRLVSDAILRLNLDGRVIVLRHEQNEWHVLPGAFPGWPSRGYGRHALREQRVDSRKVLTTWLYGFRFRTSSLARSLSHQQELDFVVR